MKNPKTKKVIHIVFIVLFCVSLVLNVFLTFRYLSALSVYRTQRLNAKVLIFSNMFMEKVLMAKEKLNFDTRLSLEMAARDLNDQEIFDQWQKFTKTETKEEASAELKVLLSLLIKKIEQ